MPRNLIQVHMELQNRKKNHLIEGCSVTRKTVYSWERNIYQPDIFQLKRIADLLGRDMEELVDLTVEKIE